MSPADAGVAAAGAAGRFDDVAGALDAGTWATHLMLREQLGVRELVELIGQGYLPPEIELTWAGQLQLGERIELLHAAASSPLLVGKGPGLAEKMVVSAPAAGDAAATIAQMPATWFTFPFLQACRLRWGADELVWDACVRAASRDIDALERLWRLPLPRTLAQLSLVVWDQQVLRLIELAGGEGPAEEAGQALLEALGTLVQDPEAMASPSPARLQVQARVLQHRHRLPDWVWLSAVSQVTEAVLREAVQRTEGTGRVGRALVADEVARRSRWLQLGVQLHLRCVSAQARERVEQMWGPSAADLAGTVRSRPKAPATSATAGPLQLAVDALDEVAAQEDRTLGAELAQGSDRVVEQILAVLCRVDASGAAGARSAQMGALGARLVQLLVLCGADRQQWATVLSDAAGVTGSVAGVALGMLEEEDRLQLWDQVDDVSARRGSDRTWLPEPGDVAAVSVAQLTSRLLLEWDNAELLHDMLRARGVPQHVAADAYRLALALLDELDTASVGDLVDTVAATLSAPSTLTS